MLFNLDKIMAACLLNSSCFMPLVLKVKKNNQFLSDFAGNNNSKQDLIQKVQKHV